MVSRSNLDLASSIYKKGITEYNSYSNEQVIRLIDILYENIIYKISTHLTNKEDYQSLLYDNIDNKYKGIFYYLHQALINSKDIRLQLITVEDKKFVTNIVDTNNEKEVLTIQGSKNRSALNILSSIIFPSYILVDSYEKKNLSLGKTLFISLLNLDTPIENDDIEKQFLENFKELQDIYVGKNIELNRVSTNTFDATNYLKMNSNLFSFITNLPSSFLNGMVSGSLGITSDADSKLIDDGLKKYFFQYLYSIFKKADVNIDYRSNFDIDNYGKIITLLNNLSISKNDLNEDEYARICNNLLKNI